MMMIYTIYCDTTILFLENTVTRFSDTTYYPATEGPAAMSQTLSLYIVSTQCVHRLEQNAIHGTSKGRQFVQSLYQYLSWSS